MLCRCTGYVKIVEAVMATSPSPRLRGEADSAEGRAGEGPGATLHPAPHPLASRVGLSPQAGRGEACVGARLPRLDGWPKVAGTDKFGADEAPADALWLRVVRSPHARARFTLGDLEACRAAHPGLEAILTAADVPGENAFGIFPDTKDQPVLRGRRGALPRRGGARRWSARAQAVDGIADAELPIAWTPLAPLSGIEAALRRRRAGAPRRARPTTS